MENNAITVKENHVLFYLGSHEFVCSCFVEGYSEGKIKVGDTLTLPKDEHSNEMVTYEFLGSSWNHSQQSHIAEVKKV